MTEPPAIVVDDDLDDPNAIDWTGEIFFQMRRQIAARSQTVDILQDSIKLLKEQTAIQSDTISMLKKRLALYEPLKLVKADEPS